MSIAENKARYEGTAFQQLMENSGHVVCNRCYCCDAVNESSPCWQCGGFDPDGDDEWEDWDCPECHGEREVFYTECLGRCDENGNHKPCAAQPVGTAKPEKDTE